MALGPFTFTGMTVASVVPESALASTTYTVSLTNPQNVTATFHGVTETVLKGVEDAAAGGTLQMVVSG